MIANQIVDGGLQGRERSQQPCTTVRIAHRINPFLVNSSSSSLFFSQSLHISSLSQRRPPNNTIYVRELGTTLFSSNSSNTFGYYSNYLFSETCWVVRTSKAGNNNITGTLVGSAVSSYRQ